MTTTSLRRYSISPSPLSAPPLSASPISASPTYASPISPPPATHLRAARSCIAGEGSAAGPQIYSDASLSQNVCNSCVDAALQSLMFWKQCEESEKKWSALTDILYKSTLSLELNVKNKDTQDTSKPVFVFINEKFKEIIMPTKIANSEKNVIRYVAQNHATAVDEVSLEHYFDDGPNGFDSDCNLEHTSKKKAKKKKDHCKPLNSTENKYDCSHCSQRFLKKEYLITHLKVKHNSFQKVECNVCNKKFTSLWVLRKHVSMHKTPEVYRCSLCDQVFNLAMKLEAHITEIHCKKKFQCLECPELFYRASDAKKHQMKVHDSGHEHVCKHCGKKYQSLARLLNHEVKHKGVFCHKCGQRFRFPYKLKHHFAKCSGKKEKKMIQRQQCPKSLKSERKHHNKADKNYSKYECEMCNRTFASEARLKCHLARHTGVVCEKCGRHFKYQSQLKNHTNLCLKDRRPGNPRCVREPAGPPQFICDHCGKDFNFKESLKSHIKSQHLFHNVYRCNHCDRRFSYKGGLTAHLVVHTRERSEQCDICGKYFVTKPALVYHTRLHTGERPFACDMCDERFLSASRRMAHVRTKHWGRTEQCTVCLSMFYTPYAMRKHMSRHFDPKSKLFCNKPTEDFIQ